MARGQAPRGLGCGKEPSSTSLGLDTVSTDVAPERVAALPRPSPGWPGPAPLAWLTVSSRLDRVEDPARPPPSASRSLPSEPPASMAAQGLGSGVSERLAGLPESPAQRWLDLDLTSTHWRLSHSLRGDSAGQRGADMGRAVAQRRFLGLPARLGCREAQGDAGRYRIWAQKTN